MSTRDWTTATDEEVMEADVALELELDKLPQEVTLSLIAEMGEQVNQAVLKKALAGLTDEQRTELEQLVASGDADATQAKLDTYVPNYAQIAWEETVRFKRIMLTESPAEKELIAAGQAALDKAENSDLSS